MRFSTPAPREVFLDRGVSPETYVAVDGGRLERGLTHTIEWRGNAHVSGPSKTGKSVLVNHVLQKTGRPSIWVSGAARTAREVWKNGLEKLATERIDSRTIGVEAKGAAEIQTGLGPFGILADWIGRARLGLTGTVSEDSARTRILAEPSAEHLAAGLQKTGAVFVLDNAHALAPGELEIVCHGLRDLEPVNSTAIIISARPMASRMAIRGADLTGRTADIEVTVWSQDDLSAIVRRGCRALRVAPDDFSVSCVAHWSAGLPIVAQQCCRELLEGNLGGRPRSSIWTPRRVADAMHEVCMTYYVTYQASSYAALAHMRAGDSRRAAIRKGILMAFEQIPLIASIRAADLARVGVREDTDLVGSVVREMAEDATRVIGEPLVEWDENNSIAQITDPSLHFYCVWRRNRPDEDLIVES